MLVYRLPVPDFARWRRESAMLGQTRLRLGERIRDARSLVLLIEPFQPLVPTGEGVAISPYYVASNALYHAAAERGLRDITVPVKPLIAGYGIGAYGKCGIVAIPGIGTRFAAQVLGSDEEPEASWEWREDRAFSPECENCSICLDCCPTGALDGSGFVDTDKCLRAQASCQTAMPEDSRGLIGAIVWGCEDCQSECPRNRGAQEVPMPEGLETALQLKKLLNGDVAELGAWIGSNYARPARMQARACVIAANLGRRDLAEEIRALLSSPVEAVRDCARWALRKLDVEG